MTAADLIRKFERSESSSDSKSKSFEVRIGYGAGQTNALRRFDHKSVTNSASDAVSNSLYRYAELWVATEYDVKNMTLQIRKIHIGKILKKIYSKEIPVSVTVDGEEYKI